MFGCVTTSTTSYYGQQRSRDSISNIPSNMSVVYQQQQLQANEQRQLPQYQQQYSCYEHRGHDVVFHLDDFPQSNDYYFSPNLDIAHSLSNMNDSNSNTSAVVSLNSVNGVNLNIAAQRQDQQQQSQPQHQYAQHDQQQQSQQFNNYYQCTFGDHMTAMSGTGTVSSGSSGTNVDRGTNFQQHYQCNEYTNLDNIEPSLITTTSSSEVRLESRYQLQQVQSVAVSQNQSRTLVVDAVRDRNIMPTRNVQQPKYKSNVGVTDGSISAANNLRQSGGGSINMPNNSGVGRSGGVELPTYYQVYHSSPTGSTHTSSGSTDLSEETDEMFGFTPAYKQKGAQDRDLNKKHKRQMKKRKPKRDPNEPQKPVSAYALFFRDTQATIKGKSPNASFGEVSKIVASMWDSLDADSKNAYKQKTESAKKDYLKQLAAYRANLLTKSGVQANTVDQFSIDSHFAASVSSRRQTAADSTTSALASGGGSLCESATSSSATNASTVGHKSLASLIAEPAPQRLLTATTTLTVPQAYNTTNRNKVEYDLDSSCDFANVNICQRSGCMKQAIESQLWNRDYCSSECVVKHCRDAFGGWVRNRQVAESGGSTYAPV